MQKKTQDVEVQLVSWIDEQGINAGIIRADAWRGPHWDTRAYGLYIA